MVRNVAVLGSSRKESKPLKIVITHMVAIVFCESVSFCIYVLKGISLYGL